MTKPKVISLFSGAGGLDYGFEAAGFENGVCLEIDADCCATLRASRPTWNVIERSISSVSAQEILDTCNCRVEEVDVLIGGPPCQPFSKAGYWARGDSLRLEDSRAFTLTEYLRILEGTLPRAFVLENVEGLIYGGKDEGLKLLLNGIKSINKRTKNSYRPHVRVLNAASYGVPQLRERVFLVAARDGRAFDFPEPTHGDVADNSISLFAHPTTREPFRCAWDALADVIPAPEEDLALRGKWADLLPSIPEGQNYLWHTDRGGGRRLFGWRRRYWTFLLKLAKDRPSWTIQAQPGPAVGPFHWHNRRLSTRELCRLQTFPDDVLVQGGRSSAQKQIGNAVPSLLAEVLGREIRAQLLDLPAMKEAPRLMPTRRLPIPPEEPHGEVPPQFLSLEGDHEAHPGTGKGYAARARSLGVSPL